MDLVNNYINDLEGEKKEWVTTFVTFMRENFPDIKETISFQIPTYKFNGIYISFSAKAKEHFTFHSIDFEMIEELKKLLPNAKFGKGCAKVKYEDQGAIPVLCDMCRKIIERSNQTR